MRQFAFADTQGSNGTQVLTVRFPRPTLAGSAIFAWSRSAIDGQTQNFATFTDDHGNNYFATGDTRSDPIGTVNAAEATAYAANVASGTSRVTATWVPFGDFRSIVVAEVTGVSAQPLLGHASNIQTTRGAGAGSIASGNVNIAVQPALILAISTSEFQTHGAPFAPNAGSGFTSLGTVTNYGTSPDGGRLEYKVTTTAAYQAALFDAVGADKYFTFAIVFR